MFIWFSFAIMYVVEFFDDYNKVLHYLGRAEYVYKKLKQSYKVEIAIVDVTVNSNATEPYELIYRTIITLYEKMERDK